MTRFLVIATILAVTFGLALGSRAAQTQAKSNENQFILLTEENAPYSFSDADTGVISGTGVELVAELMKKAELPYSLSILPWNRAFRQAQDSPNTCLFVVNRTAARESLFSWVGPLFEGGWAVYKRPDSPISIQSVKDLKGYNVIGKAGSASVAEIEKAAGIKIVRTGKDETAAKLLYYGRADLWVSGVIDGPLAAKAANLPAPALALLWTKADLSMACSKETDPALITKLNEINLTLNELRKKVLAQHLAELSRER